MGKLFSLSAGEERNASVVNYGGISVTNGIKKITYSLQIQLGFTRITGLVNRGI